MSHIQHAAGYETSQYIQQLKLNPNLFMNKSLLDPSVLNKSSKAPISSFQHTSQLRML